MYSLKLFKNNFCNHKSVLILFSFIVLFSFIALFSFQSSSLNLPFFKKKSLNQEEVYKNLSLKKQDKLKKLNQKNISSFKSFSKSISSLKKGNPFSLLIEREAIKFLLTYKVKGKNKFELIKVQKIEIKKVSKQKNQKQKNLKKYKPYLQNAYIVKPNSFIYKKPDFDSPQLLSVEVGKKVLISKKVFKPKHSFGSFYKVVIEKPKRLVGYISQIEALPEFLKIDKSYKKNTCFSQIENQLKKTGQADLSFISRKRHVCFLDPKSFSSLKKKSRAKGSQYVGLFVAMFSHPLHFIPYKETEMALGLQFNDKARLLPYVHSHFRFGVNPRDTNSLYTDISFGYPLLGLKSLRVYGMLGFSFDDISPIDLRHAREDDSVWQSFKKVSHNLGKTFSNFRPFLDLSFSLPVKQALDLQLSLKASDGLAPIGIFQKKPKVDIFFSIQRRL